MDKIQVLDAFWNSFGLPAYDINSVPTGAAFPYITYEVSISDFDNSIQNDISVWYKGTSWAEISKKVDEIFRMIGRGGIVLTYDGGAIWLTRGVNFAQRMTDPNDLIKRYILQVNVEYIE